MRGLLGSMFSTTAGFSGPSRGPGSPSSYAINPDASLDVMGTIQGINDQQINSTVDPTGGMTGGPGMWGQKLQGLQARGGRGLLGSIF